MMDGDSGELANERAKGVSCSPQESGFVRVATFNCEWRRTNSADGAIIRERVLNDSTDVVCLTETHRDFLEGQGFTATSAPLQAGPNVESRRKVLLWSRRPWTAVDAVGPPGLPEGRYVAGTTSTPAGQVRVVGLVIPYGFAGVRLGQPKRRPWELHLEYLEALGRSLAGGVERTIVLGDFNQRVPRKYQPKRIFESLQSAVLDRLHIATAGVLASVQRQAIDHVCHSSDLVCRGADSLSNERPGGGRISDHFGVRVELTPA
jgi:hypothetical protein